MNDSDFLSKLDKEMAVFMDKGDRAISYLLTKLDEAENDHQKLCVQRYLSDGYEYEHRYDESEEILNQMVTNSEACALDWQLLAAFLFRIREKPTQAFDAISKANTLAVEEYKKQAFPTAVREVKSELIRIAVGIDKREVAVKEFQYLADFKPVSEAQEARLSSDLTRILSREEVGEESYNKFLQQLSR